MELTFDMDEARVTVDADYNSMWEEWTVEVLAVELFDDEGNFIRTLEGEQCKPFHDEHYWLIEALTEKAARDYFKKHDERA